MFLKEVSKPPKEDSEFPLILKTIDKVASPILAMMVREGRKRA
jgi:hypothetical protein